MMAYQIKIPNYKKQITSENQAKKKKFQITRNKSQLRTGKKEKKKKEKEIPEARRINYPNRLVRYSVSS